MLRQAFQELDAAIAQATDEQLLVMQRLFYLCNEKVYKHYQKVNNGSK